MTKISGGEALVQSLVREGVEVVFGLPGVQMYGIVDALRKEKSIKFVVTRHEQATTYMADGYARTTGKPGVALVVPGPGIYNAGAGISTAFSRSSPVILIAGQIPRKTIGKNFGGLHEVNDQKEITRPITKWQKLVLNAKEIPENIHEAFFQAQSGRPSPVHFELPPEAMVEKDNINLMEPKVITRIAPELGRIKKAAKILLGAKKPVIYAGGGVARSNAESKLEEFVNLTKIPVITSAGGKGTLSDAHPLSLGSSLSGKGLLKDYMDSADVILGVGTRFSMRDQSGGKAKLIHIDIDPNMIGHIHKDTYGLIGDAQETLRLLSEEIQNLKYDSWRNPEKEILEIKSKLSSNEDELNYPQEDFLNALREGVPSDAITIFGMTQMGYYSRSRWSAKSPKSYIDSGYSGNLGYSFPTALGAKIGNPDKAVICICGDGGFMYNSSEISTAVKYGINLVTLIYNDGSYGNVARDLDNDFGGAYETDFVNPDFVKLAKSFGAVGIRAKNPMDVNNIIPDAIKLDKPVFIDVPMDRVPRPKQWATSAPWRKPQEGLIK